MAFTLNKIMLIGTLGGDAELTTTSGGADVAKFSIATNHSYKNKESGYTDETTWHNITAFSVSDWTKERLKKGSKVYLEGRLSKREYEKDGIKKLAVEVVADSFSIMILNDTKNESGNTKTESYYKEPSNNDTPEPLNIDDSLPF